MTDLRCVDHGCLDGPPLDGQPSGRLVHLPALLCSRCEAALTKRLAEMPARRDLLRDTLGGIGGTRSSENKPTKGNPPVPLNIAAHDLLVDMQAKAVSWTQLVCEERGLRGPDQSDLRVLAPWLVSQVDWLIEQPWVDDLAEEMRDLARQADGLTAHRARWNRLEAPCPDCGAHELGRWDGSDDVHCLSCGMKWDRPALMEKQTARHTLTAASAAAWLRVRPATFRGYVAAGTIKSIGKDGDGLLRYAAEDVKALDTDEEQTA